MSVKVPPRSIQKRQPSVAGALMRSLRLAGPEKGVGWYQAYGRWRWCQSNDNLSPAAEGELSNQRNGSVDLAIT